MRFNRCVFGQGEDRPVSSRRLAAAARWLAKENDKVSLFPELQTQQTPEERIASCDEAYRLWTIKFRAHTAANWRRARRLLRALPEQDKTQVLAWWNQDGFHCPYEAHYLLDHLLHITE